MPWSKGEVWPGLLVIGVTLLLCLAGAQEKAPETLPTRQAFLRFLQETYQWDNRQGYPLPYLDRFRRDRELLALLAALPRLRYRFRPEDYQALRQLKVQLQQDHDLATALFSTQTRAFIGRLAAFPCLCPTLQFTPARARELVRLADQEAILPFAERLCRRFKIPITLAVAEDLLALFQHPRLPTLLPALEALGYTAPGLPYLAVPPLTYLRQLVQAQEALALLPVYVQIKERYRLPPPQNNDLLVDLATLYYNQEALTGCALELADRLQARGDRFRIKDLYLLARICDDPTATRLLGDRDRLASDVRQRLVRLPHRKRQSLEYDESPQQVVHLTTLQLFKVHLLLTTLQDPAQRQHLGSLIAQDRADGQRELGGVVVLEKGALVFLAIPGRQGNNLRYDPPQRLRYDTRFARFHLHAVSDDDTEAAGPSLLDLYRIAQYRHDEVIVTNLGNGSINVDGVFHRGRVAAPTALPSQLVTLDLGVYDTH